MNEYNFTRTQRYLIGFLILVIILPLISRPIIAQSTVTFLPFISGGTDFRSTNTDGADSCLLIDEIGTMETLFKNDAEQRRAAMNCSPILMQVAQERAEDMAKNNYFSHINSDGEGPNYLAVEAGYQFPSFYSTTRSANQIESIYAGSPNASSVWARWMTSASHRSHLLGLMTMFAEQDEYGIGYAYNPNSEYKHYWVVLTGKRG